MRLYSVLNGYIGESAVSVLVIAESEEGAISLACEKYKKEGHKDINYSSPKGMTALLLCPDTSKQWASSVSDGVHDE